jgi:hypothetical protein
MIQIGNFGIEYFTIIYNMNATEICHRYLIPSDAPVFKLVFDYMYPHLIISLILMIGIAFVLITAALGYMWHQFDLIRGNQETQKVK